MNHGDDVVVRSTPDAPWLPPGSRAEVVRSSTAPTPACLVRLLLRRGDEVFCVPRERTAALDLPTRVVDPADPDGRATAARLALDVLGQAASLVPVGFVRNVVPQDAPGYGWPVPLAHFVVWATTGVPVVEGEWVDARGPRSLLADRHWFPLLSALGRR